MTVLTLRPNADDSVALTPTPTGTHYTCVDESTEDLADCVGIVASTSANNTVDVNATDRFGLPNHSAETGTISKVTVKARSGYTFVYGTFYAAQITLGLYISSTEYFASAQNLTTSDATYYNEWPTNPNTGVAFSWSDIDALKGLLNLRASVGALYYTDKGSYYAGYVASYCYQYWIEVEYSTVSGKTQTLVFG